MNKPDAVLIAKIKILCIPRNKYYWAKKSHKPLNVYTSTMNFELTVLSEKNLSQHSLHAM